MGLLYILLPDGSTSAIDNDAGFGQWRLAFWYVGTAWLGEILNLCLDWSKGKPDISVFGWWLDRNASLDCISIIEAHLKLSTQPPGTYDLEPPASNPWPVIGYVALAVGAFVGIAYAYSLIKKRGK